MHKMFATDQKILVVYALLNNLDVIVEIEEDSTITKSILRVCPFRRSLYDACSFYFMNDDIGILRKHKVIKFKDLITECEKEGFRGIAYNDYPPSFWTLDKIRKFQIYIKDKEKRSELYEKYPVLKEKLDDDLDYSGDIRMKEFWSKVPLKDFLSYFFYLSETSNEGIYVIPGGRRYYSDFYLNTRTNTLSPSNPHTEYTISELVWHYNASNIDIYHLIKKEYGVDIKDYFGKGREYKKIKKGE